MFTGLVAQISSIASIARSAKGATLRIPTTFTNLILGESIAVDGTCLTVTKILDGMFEADASLETLARTTLGAAKPGRRVHLERALSIGDRLGGHFVTGHVDGVGRIARRSALGDALAMTCEAPQTLAPFLAPKASITIDGTSLTVNAVRGREFDVVLVPFTQTETTFASRPDGDAVNLEADVLAKYVARLLGRADIDGYADSISGGITLEMLTKHGYM